MAIKMKKGSESKNSSSEVKKNKSSLYILLVVLALGAAGYYFFVLNDQSPDQSALNRPSVVGSSTDKKDVTAQKFRKLNYGFFYGSKRQQDLVERIVQDFSADFSQHGLDIETSVYKLASADVDSNTKFDFLFRELISIIGDSETSSNLKPLYSFNGCSSRYVFFVKKESPFFKASDLKGKKIVYNNLQAPTNLAISYLMKNGLTDQELYSTTFFKLGFTILDNGAVDALLLTEMETKEQGKLYPGAMTSPEELVSNYRRLEDGSDSVPCLAIFASNKLEPEILEKFTSLHRDFKTLDFKPITKGLYFSSLDEFTSDDLKKIESGMDMNAINEIKKKIRQVKPDPSKLDLNAN